MTEISVLVVEDNRDLAEIYRVALGNAGMSVEVCLNGEQADEVSGRPDTVILDLHLPGKTGYQVFEEMARKWPGIKVLVVTADNALAVAMDALGAEKRPVCVLMKPVGMADLVDLIRKFVGDSP
jgi:DNA-binding response OmpR family regulator